MQCNLTKTQKVVRIVLGTALLVIGAATQSWWGLLGLFPIHTATIGWCPKGLFCAVKSNAWWHACCDGCC